jgi:hypothetical protein
LPVEFTFLTVKEELLGVAASVNCRILPKVTENKISLTAESLTVQSLELLSSARGVIDDTETFGIEMLKTMLNLGIALRMSEVNEFLSKNTIDLPATPYVTLSDM